MKYCVDLNPQLLEKISTFLLEQKDSYSKYHVKENVYTWNLLMANINRIRELVKYFSSERMILDSNDEFSNFVFGDWIIYSAQIRDLINSLFNFLGHSDKYIAKRKYFIFGSEDSTDDNFLEYIRSLSSIHPLNTSRHKKKGYQKYLEYSPNISAPRELNALLKKMSKYASNDFPLKEQYTITIYSSAYVKDSELNEEYKKQLSYYKKIACDENEFLHLSDNIRTSSDTYVFLHPQQIIYYCEDCYKQLDVLFKLISCVSEG